MRAAVALTADEVLAIYDASLVVDELHRQARRCVPVRRCGFPEREINLANLSRAMGALASKLSQKNGE